MAASILLICYSQFRVEPRISDVLCEDVVEEEKREVEAAKYCQVSPSRKS
jgi:hypothetical protein